MALPEPPLRVLLVSHVAPPHVGGVEQLARHEAEALRAEGHEVTWSTSDADGAGEVVAARPGLHIERVRAWHVMERRFHIAYPLFGPGLWWRMWKAVGKVDLVHVHGLVFMNSIAAVVVARLRGRRCVLTDHGGIQRYKSKLGTFALRVLIETMGRITAHGAHRLIAYNADLERLLARLSGKASKVQFLANPVDSHRFHPPSVEERSGARKALGWDDLPRLLFVGRVLPHKGIDLMLALVDAGHEVVFVGPASDEMVQKIEAAGARHLPPRGQHEIAPVYHAADVLVLPSHNEGFPLVIQEALACGLPVVARDHAAYEPYRGIDGLTFVPGEAAALRAAVDRAIADRRGGHPGLRPPPWLGRQAWVAQLLQAAGVQAD
jgi:D-inositol-3-phosphate glycosyltransferase